MEIKSKEASKYAKENNISQTEAYKKLNSVTINRESTRRVDPETKSEIKRKFWCSLTKADPTPCNHTTQVLGCTHCEYNAGQDVPTSCKQGANMDPKCDYCQSTEFIVK